MVTIFELLINGFVAVVLLPLAIVSLGTGSKPPEHSFFGKVYRAEPYLMLAGNLMLLTIGATAITTLAQILGYLDSALAEQLKTWISFPLMFMVVIVLFLLARGVIRARRSKPAG